VWLHFAAITLPCWQVIMMKLKRAILKTFMAVSLLLASCSQFNSQFMVYKEDDYVFQDYVAVKAILANYRAVMNDSNELHSSQSKARLIRPDINAGEYDFYIYGQKNINDTKNIIGPVNITSQLSSSGDSGEFEFNVSKGIWYMTLIAVKHNEEFTSQSISTVTSKALLWGSCVTDIQNSSSNPSFLLSDAGLTTPGTINLPLTLDGWTLPENVTAKAGIYYLKTGKAIDKTEQTLTITGNSLSNYAPQDGGNALNIAPGTYTFRLTFTKDGSDWIWTDQIHIFPGREINKEIFIPQVINAIPAAPENFAFALDSLDDVSDYGDYYLGTFNWAVPAAGTTATEYELRLYDEGEGKEYITYNPKTLGTYSFLRKNGSLDINSTSLTLWLPLGKKLSAQLRAVNKTGNSDANWEQTKIENINRYRITYNLNGGSTQTNFFGENTTGQKESFYDYGSVSSPHVWKTPTKDDIKIIKDGETDKIFDYWSLSSGEDAAQFDSTVFDGFSNITLYAKYKLGLTYQLLDTSKVLIAFYKDSNKTIDVLDENKTLNVSYNALSSIIGINNATKLDVFILTKGFEYDTISTTYTENKSIFSSEEVTITVSKNKIETIEYNGTNYNGYHFALSTKNWSRNSDHKVIFHAVYGAEKEDLEINIHVSS